MDKKLAIRIALTVAIKLLIQTSEALAPAEIRPLVSACGTAVETMLSKILEGAEKSEN